MTDKPENTKGRFVSHNTKIELIGDVLECILEGIALNRQDVEKIKSVINVLRNPKSEVKE